MSAFVPGSLNLITDVKGILVGHADDERAQSGVTTVLCERSHVAAVDVRGGGPGARETDALRLENVVGRAHAIVFSGGSVFGLAAADGVTAGLSARGEGLRWRAGTPSIPIVPAAVLHDLGFTGDKQWGANPPYRALGLASLDAVAREFALGSVGAGRGARAGLLKGGVGSASLALDASLMVGALVAVNCVGSVLMPDDKTYWAWPFELNNEFGGSKPASMPPAADPLPAQTRLAELGRLQPGANTTLALVACNADLTGPECKRIAIMAHDGIARAIRPAHTPFDGDIVFALATGSVALSADAERAAHVARLGAAAADCLARAIARGVHVARGFARAHVTLPVGNASGGTLAGV